MLACFGIAKMPKRIPEQFAGYPYNKPWGLVILRDMNAGAAASVLKTYRMATSGVPQPPRHRPDVWVYPNIEQSPTALPIL